MVSGKDPSANALDMAHPSRKDPTGLGVAQPVCCNCEPGSLLKRSHGDEKTVHLRKSPECNNEDSMKPKINFIQSRAEQGRPIRLFH